DRPTLTCYGLAIGDGCVWYAGVDAVVGLAVETGAIAVRHAMKEYFQHVLATPHGVVTVRETKIDRVDRAGVTRIADVPMADRSVLTNGGWLVARQRNTDAKDLVIVTPNGVVSLVKLVTPAATVVLDGTALVLGARKSWEYIVVPLEELGDAKRKSL